MKPKCPRCWSSDHDVRQCPWADASAKSLRERRQALIEAEGEEPKKWDLPVTDTDIFEFCSQLPPETRTKLYKQLHALGERL